MKLPRRDFLCRCCTSLGAMALAIERFGLVNAFAQTSDYKALVCVFLFGGNDSDNMVVPHDNYAEYAAVRNPNATTVYIPQEALLPISPPSGRETYGLHPSFTALHPLFAEGKLAIVTNMGPLVEPTTRETYRNGTARRPINLFSHSDQQSLWQTSISTSLSQTGWGGRIADRAHGLNPSTSTFPMMVTTAGLTVFASGSSSRPLAVAPHPTPVNAALRLDGFDESQASTTRRDAMVRLLGVDTSPVLVRNASAITRTALEIQAVLRTVPEPAVPEFPNTPLAYQLWQVAKLIALRDMLGLRRQIFFCSIGGFDLHANEPATHAGLLTQLSGALRAFYDATVALGVASQVTTFTMSDFARTFRPNGNQGTDHAWGSHQFVMGGAVRGGDFYYGGDRPFPRLIPDGDDDADAGSGARGRWIPKIAVEQYGATLASWYGVSGGDLAAVFPNLSRFDRPNLGFV
jgi:uncharacterized protein (DUF1501 family)